MKTSPLSPKGESTAPPGRVDQNLTDKWSDVLILGSTFTFVFRRGGQQNISQTQTKICIRFVKTKMKTIFDFGFRNGSVKFIGCFYRSQNFSGPVPAVRALFTHFFM
jgi:hypothetical protein